MGQLPVAVIPMANKQAIVSIPMPAILVLRLSVLFIESSAFEVAKSLTSASID